jgi:hypothetical protein
MTPAPLTSLYRLDRDLTRDQLIDALAQTPALLRSAVVDATGSGLVRARQGGEWSAMQICRHIRDAVQIYGLRFKYIILEDDPFLPNFDEDAWAADSPDGPTNIDSLLSQVEGDRAETIRLLRAMPPAAWSRTGRHEVLGSVVLEPYVRHELVHEEQHLAQLQSALKGQDR